MKLIEKVIFMIERKTAIIEENKSIENYWRSDFIKLFPEHAFDVKTKEKFIEIVKQGRENYIEYRWFVRSRTRNTGRMATRRTIEKMIEWYNETDQPIHAFALNHAMKKSWGTV